MRSALWSVAGIGIGCLATLAMARGNGQQMAGGAAMALPPAPVAIVQGAKEPVGRTPDVPATRRDAGETRTEARDAFPEPGFDRDRWRGYSRRYDDGRYEGYRWDDDRPYDRWRDRRWMWRDRPYGRRAPGYRGSPRSDRYSGRPWMDDRRWAWRRSPWRRWDGPRRFYGERHPSWRHAPDYDDLPDEHLSPFLPPGVYRAERAGTVSATVKVQPVALDVSQPRIVD
jgi:hypothetical protein